MIVERSTERQKGDTSCMACGGPKVYIFGSTRPRSFGFPYVCDPCRWDEDTCEGCGHWNGKHFGHCQSIDS